MGWFREDDYDSESDAEVFCFPSVSASDAEVFCFPSVSVGSVNLPNFVAQQDAAEKEMLNKMSEPSIISIFKKRRLRFAPTISTVVGEGLSREDYTEQEKKNCWFSSEEMFRSRAHAKRVMTLIMHSGQHFLKMIDDSFKLAQFLSTSLQEKELDALMRDPNNYRSEIDASEFNGHGRRGLERQMSVFQKMRARDIRVKVLHSQSMDLTSEEIAEIYAEDCLASRIYSRWMGRVDHTLAYVM
jgi:hypothetical protein